MSNLTLPTFQNEWAFDSDTVGLSGGGFVTAATDAAGDTDLVFYDASGKVTGSNFNFSTTESAIAQLTNGNVVTVGTGVNGGINFKITTATGVNVGAASNIGTNLTESHADVAALAGGGFVVVDQAAFSGTDHDIEVHIRGADGGPGTDLAVDSTSADDENASVAGLADGGFAVAWERIDGSGNTAVWRAVYNADGSVRSAPTQFDFVGTINRGVNVTALKSGGFAVGYEDNGFDDIQPDITLATFNSAGSFQGFTRAVSSSGDDSEAAVTTLSNGLVISTFSHLTALDFDIRGTLIDPITNTALTSNSDPPFLASNSDRETESSVSALAGNAQFVTTYTDQSTGTVQERTFQLVRTGTGSAGNDSFIGDDAVDVIDGFGGNDILKGGNNDDDLIGGDGNDVLNGDAGNDQLDGNAGNDILNGGIGEDNLFGDDGDDTLKGGAGNDNMTGGAGKDGYVVDSAGDQVLEAVGGGTDTVVTSVSYALTSGSEIETLRTTSSTSTTPINLTGNAFSNTLVGNAANNVLNGGTGADKLFGGAGSDTYIVDNVGDVADESIAGSGGIDKVQSAISFSLSDTTHAKGSIENLTLFGNGTVDATGNTSANVLTGNVANNVLDGKAGADTMRGAGGDDTYLVDNAGDIVDESLSGSNGIDKVQSAIAFSLTETVHARGSIENLTLTGAGNIAGTGNNLANGLTGNSGNNALKGLDGGDVMQGGAGNDVLTGGLGVDKMDGGSGNDSFVFTALNESGFTAGSRDLVAGFAAGDKINVAQIDAIAGGINNAFVLDQGGAFLAGEIRQTLSAGTLVLDFNTDGNALPEMSLQLTGRTALLSAADFVL